MDRIFLAIIASSLLVIVAAISLVAFYRDDRSASLRTHPPGIGLMEPKQVLPAEPPALVGFFRQYFAVALAASNEGQARPHGHWYCRHPQLFGLGSETCYTSSEGSRLPEIKTVGNEPFSHSAHLTFACFQCDLLSEHNITDRQTADGHETQSLLPATSFVNLAHVHRGPGMDPVSLSAVTTDDLEVTFSRELLPLCWR